MTMIERMRVAFCVTIACAWYWTLVNRACDLIRMHHRIVHKRTIDLRRHRMHRELRHKMHHALIQTQTHDRRITLRYFQIPGQTHTQMQVAISHSETMAMFDAVGAISQQSSKSIFNIFEFVTFDLCLSYDDGLTCVYFARLTVKKDGPNKGREFYKCPKQPPCNFFEWADGPALNSSFGGPRPPPGGGGGVASGSNFQNARNYGGNNSSDQGK